MGFFSRGSKRFEPAVDPDDGLTAETPSLPSGNGNGFTNLEMVEAARAITGHPIPYQMGPRRPGDPAILIASAAKIRAELGWSPQYPTVEQIIASAWEWHSRHPHGYRS